ncbi:ead/Ea22-like family protein [Salmonella enterica]|nr:ead/Ea22-like family protein [Salmonella enterica]EAO7618560.1 ead/Ea22-like family protein [Salmonella enterica]EAQ6816195.1 ead/Ea22-like family protein [Salmonella enterica]
MTIDKQALREAAEKATPGNWRRASSRFNGITVTPFSLCDEEVMLAHAVEKRDAEFIVAANPVTMLALLDELEHYKSREERVTKLVLDNSTSWDVLYEKLEAAEKRIAEQREYYEGVIADGSKRIAELEANQGKPVMFIDGDISQDDADKLAAVIREFNEDTETPAAKMARIIRENPHPTNMCDMPAAGIGVKHQEDSVDSDVGSRNQPGMVVAVHIGAGDFVKVKGQVFEVEETDFDDHDVTLWFVGGNALKCAAGIKVKES